MPFVPFSNAAEVEIRMLYLSQEVECTFGYSQNAIIVPSALTALCTTIGTKWSIEVMPLLSSSLQLLEVVARDLTSPTSFDGGWSPEGTVVGGEGGDPLPGNAAACISLRTGLTGRWFRGRNYLPGLTTNITAGNFITPDFATDMQNAYTELLGAVEGAMTGQLAVLSRVYQGADREEGVATPITRAVFADRDVDSQRRRLRGRGK